MTLAKPESQWIPTTYIDLFCARLVALRAAFPGGLLRGVWFRGKEWAGVGQDRGAGEGRGIHPGKAVARRRTRRQ